MRADTVSTEIAFSKFNDTLNREGLRPALAYLLGLTEYRYIAIFRRDGDKSNAVVYYDRENPQVVAIDEVPAAATYCQLAVETRGRFSTGDALQDPRLVSHPARRTVQAYCGFPVITPEGEILGTLCHYDVAPRNDGQINVELMVAVVSAIEQQGLVPPYPHR
jgi:GAF domain-containing protein